MLKVKAGFVVLFLTLLFSVWAYADIFNIEVKNVTKNQSYAEGFNNVEDTFDSLKIDAIKQQIAYSDTDEIVANLDFRGLKTKLTFVENSNKLILEIPSLNIKQEFDGKNRDDSIENLKDWFKKEGKDVVERIMKKLAEVSPVDPIAGNPNSALTQMVTDDFSTGFSNDASTVAQPMIKTVDTNKNYFMILPAYTQLNIGGKDSRKYDLPISYSIVFKDNPKKKITILLPISYAEVEGAKSYGIGFGLAYTQPITDNWTITPSVKYNAVGSIDLGSLGQIASASITSSYLIPLNKVRIGIGNMIGYYRTVKFYSGDYAYDPGIRNIVYRNGVMLSILTPFIKNTSLDLFATYTYFAGTELFAKDYTEVGFAYGLSKVDIGKKLTKKFSYRRDLKIGATYFISDDFSGFKINFGFSF